MTWADRSPISWATALLREDSARRWRIRRPSLRPLRGRKTRRGVVLVAVLVVVAIGALIGTSLLYSADAGGRGMAVSLRMEQSRLLAWSGVQAVMAELAAQRDDLIAGRATGAPRVTESWAAGPVGAGGGLGVFRIVRIDGELLVPEAAKLDVNTASADVLAKLPGLDEELAAVIVRERDSRAFASVMDLLRVEGITAAMLDDESGGGSAATESLRSLVTVFSFDPNVQAGIGPGGGSASGNQRIKLGTEWSPELGEAVTRRFGPDAAAALERAMSRGIHFSNDSDLVSALVTLNAPRPIWPAVVDAFTTTDGEYLLGRVDVMTAPKEILACVPGISPEAAEMIVDRRGRIEGEARATAVWLVDEEILTPAQFAEAAGHLTTRCMQWRVIIEAGTIPMPEGFFSDQGLPRIGGPVSGEGRWEVPEGAELSDRVVLEAVIDIASRRPRVAYLRDITLLPLARDLAAGVIDLGEEPAPGGARDPAAWRPAPMRSAATTPSEDGPVLRDQARLAPEGFFSDLGPLTPMVPPGLLPDDPEPTEPMNDGRIGRWTTGRGGRLNP